MTVRVAMNRAAMGHVQKATAKVAMNPVAAVVKVAVAVAAVVDAANVPHRVSASVSTPKAKPPLWMSISPRQRAMAPPKKQLDQSQGKNALPATQSVAVAVVAAAGVVPSAPTTRNKPT